MSPLRHPAFHLLPRSASSPLPCLQGGLGGARPPPLLRRSHPHLHSLGSAASEGPEPAVSPGALLESEPVTPAVPRAVSLESGGVMPPLPGGVQEVGDKGYRAGVGRIRRSVLLVCQALSW